MTQFGKTSGQPITDPGLHFKLPFIREVNRIDKRFLEWDGAPVAIPTRDKTYIHVVDTFARWRIDDPHDLFRAPESANAAPRSRLEDIPRAANEKSHRQTRPDRNRPHGQEPKPMTDESLKPGPVGIGTIGVLPADRVWALKDRR